MIDPSEALQQILQPGSLKAGLFLPTSRYYGIDTATMETNDGESIVYVKRRFLPYAERFALLQEHVVSQDDRLDNIAAHYLGDPEQYWRIADANGAMQPEHLIEVGRRLRITLPEGIPGIHNA